MNRSYRFILVVGAGALCMTLVRSSAWAQTVDLFTTAQLANSTFTATTVNGGATVIGTYRDAIFTSGVGSSAAMSITAGAATFTRNAADDSFVSLDWDGNNDAVTFDAAGLGGLDLTGGGANSFQFNITANRSANFEARIRVHTDGSNASEANPISTAGTGVQTVCYNAFSAIAGGGANFASVGAIQFDTAVGSNAQDWDIGALTFANSISCGGLPVELASFDAVTDGNAVRIQWKTASERQTLGFGLEQRSVASGAQADWSEVAFVPAAGESSSIRNYSFVVDALPAGTHSFRLRVVDMDGSFGYSPTIEAGIEHPNRFVLGAAYPNPFNPTTSVTLSVKQSQFVDVALYDLLGRNVLSVFSGPVDAGEVQTLRIDASGLTTGVYMIRATGEFETRSSAVMLVK